MKYLLLLLIFTTFSVAQQNPDYDWIFSHNELKGNIIVDVDLNTNYNISNTDASNSSNNQNQIQFSIDPAYKWLHPKPFGTSLGIVKVWDQNNIYFAGSAGTFIKTTDGGQTFSFNTYAGIPNAAPNILTNDLYGAHFIDMDNFYLCGVFGITKTTDGGQTFNQVGTGYFTNATLRDIQFLDANNGFVVGTSAAKMSQTTDGGSTWTVNQTLPSTTYYAVNAFSTNRIVVGGSTNTGGNIRLTTDGGTTWNVSAAGTGTIYSLAFFDSLIGFAGSSSKRGFKTTDGGLSWTQMTQMNAPTTSTFWDIFINGTNLYFVEDDSLLFVSADSGATFTTLQYLPTGQTKQIMRKADYFGANIVVVGDNGYLFKSTDNGTTWTSPSEVVASGLVRGVWGNSIGKIVVAGTDYPGQFLISEDYGNTFTSVALSVSAADIRGFYMIDDNTGFGVGNTGRIWKTTDGGYNWDLYVASTAAFSDVAFINTQFGVASGNNGNIFKTIDGGTNWINISNTGSTTGFNGVAIIDTNTILVAGSNIVYKTTDGGTSWSQINPGVPVSPISRIRMINENTGYLIGASGVSGFGFIFKTTDGGLSWANQNFPYSNNMLYDVAFRNDSDYVVVGAGGGVFHTTNDGASWSQYNLGLPMSGLSQVIGVTFVNQDTLLVGGAGASLVKVTLEPIVPVELASFTASVTESSVNLMWTTASELNNRGFEIERKSADSYDWKSIGFIEGSGTTTEVRSYSYQDFDVTAGSYNYRLRQIDFNGTSKIYNLSETVIVGIPNKFELLQNYPNPFSAKVGSASGGNATTRIRFSIPTSPLNPSRSQGEGNRERLVSLTVYNILEQKVATLLEEDLKPGYYEIEFDASSYNLTSGTYFYTIQAGNFYQVKKMTLIK